jgi:hypothetical protein
VTLIDQRLQQIFREAFENDKLTLADSMSPETMPQWDSLGARQADDGLRGGVRRQVHDRGDRGEHQRCKAQGGAGCEGGLALISPVAESELGDVMRFLRTVFGVGESHRMFQADVLRWKCFAPHPFWEGSRGYALRYRGEIAAFGCVVPCRFLTGSGTVASCNVIDWAASKSVPGAGIMLYRHIQGLTGAMINIGGTADARQVLPRIGFQARSGDPPLHARAAAVASLPGGGSERLEIAAKIGPGLPGIGTRGHEAGRSDGAARG